MPQYQGTSIAESPTFEGLAGRAWRVRMPPIGQRGRPDYDASIDLFLINVPGAHVFWSYWMVTAIHLRPISGVKPAHISVAGATHELMILALNPERPLPSLDYGEGWNVAYLTPIDVMEQFKASDDAVAQQIVELAVRAIVDGIASPDQDYRAWWRQAIARTAAHYANDSHHVERH